MSKPADRPRIPLTDREYAYIRISGPGDYEAITHVLRLSPSEAWNVGDINPNNGTPRAHMSWQLQSGLDDTHALREHIEALLSIIGTRAEAIRTLWVDYDIQLQCVGYYLPPGHGAHLDRECVRQAARARTVTTLSTDNPYRAANCMHNARVQSGRRDGLDSCSEEPSSPSQ